MLRAALLFFAVFAMSPAWADSLRCSSKLVRDGDIRSEVRAKCGKPAEVETRTILRRPVVWIRGRPYHLGDDMVEVPVEIWTYNFGPNQLMRRIKFVDGKLEEIETLGHGYLSES